ncbi:lipopolysaccharide assembly protein LapA domain-containing protein [Moraxella sp. Tifton1]|uniref:lipopolysaccharide assembly protein LapA domain-containing protein n=1 Tax=Moraxella oculi TaxID=2940516 RepID=UPI0020124BC6|nr:lipopolysaccharide assembly protein LapA domain-containing protein [Moraxella sp. Tifton1]MCL1622655.1 lipopolysaccharide assembly protein LapA domain-containing protein [Moraxella sp. Tifton1]
MHIVLIVLLAAVCAYAIGLVLINNREVAVNLIFSDVPAMNLGLLLIITIALGLVLGMLLALLVFRVFQNKWEISRLSKELKLTQSQLTEANIKLAQQAESLAAQTVVVETVTPNHLQNTLRD